MGHFVGDAGAPLAWLTSTTFMHNELWRWLVLLGLLLSAMVLGRTVSFALQGQASRIDRSGKAKLAAVFLKSLAGPVGMALLGAALYVAGMFLRISRTVGEGDQQITNIVPLIRNDFWVGLCKTIIVLAVAWFVFKLVDIVEIFLKRWTATTETLLDDQLVPILRKTLRVFVVIVAFLFVAQNIFDWNIGALVAGLGIGGLAFALAAKDMLANLFGSVTIFSDRPFQLGDRVVIQGHDGMIEEVGFRSTRLRLLTGHQVVIPNAVVANEAIENITRRPYIKRVLDVTVTYDTSPEMIQRGVAILNEMLEARKGAFAPDQPPRVYFSDFNAASLNIQVYYWFTPPDWWEYLAFNHEFNMELLRRFNEEGIEFAFPTQTLYLKQDLPMRASIQLADQSQPPSVHT